MVEAADASAAAVATDGDGHFSQNEIDGLTPIQPVRAATTYRKPAKRVARRIHASRSPASSSLMKRSVEREMVRAKERLLLTGEHQRRRKPPISYARLSTDRRSPSATIAFRHTEKPNLVTPGPGSYISTDDRAVAKTARGAPRFAQRLKEPSGPVFLLTKDTPGPVSYTTPQDFGRGGKAVSIASHLQHVYRTASPGPCSYTVPPSIGKVHGRLNGPACSLSGRTVLPGQDDPSPGPGAYTPTSSFRPAKGPSISVKRETPDWTVVPGPGAYSHPVCDALHFSSLFGLSKTNLATRSFEQKCMRTHPPPSVDIGDGERARHGYLKGSDGAAPPPKGYVWTRADTYSVLFFSRTRSGSAVYELQHCAACPGSTEAKV